jgi:hypothetical protein
VGQHAAYHSLQAGVGLGIDVATGTPLCDAFEQRLKTAAVNTIASYAANTIGAGVKDGSIDGLSHKFLHGIVGGVSGAALSKDTGAGAVSGALGAFVAETFTDILRPADQIQADVSAMEAQLGRPLTQSEYSSIEQLVKKDVYDYARLISATSVLLAGYDVSLADHAATNALDNNFLVLVYWGGMAVSVGYSAYQFMNTLESHGVEVACSQLGLDLAVTLASGAAARGGAYVVGKLLAQHPALKVVLTANMDKLVKAVDRYIAMLGNSKAGAAVVSGARTAVKKVNHADQWARGVEKRVGDRVLKRGTKVENAAEKSSALPGKIPDSVRYVDEKASMHSTAKLYNDSALGARSNVQTKLVQAPALDYIGKDGVTKTVRFDGIEKSILT